MRAYLPFNNPPTHADVAKRQNVWVKKRAQSRRAEGLCPTCGDEPRDGVAPQTGKPYILCKECSEKSNVKVKESRGDYDDPTHGAPHPITTTKQHYRVIKTGEVGFVAPCPGDNPLILEFKGNLRHVYHIDQIEKTDLPITDSVRNRYRQNGRKGGGQIGLTDRSIEKMFAMLRFLEEQEGPVRAYAITKACGFSCTHLLMHCPSNITNRPNFENLKIAKRTTPIGRVCLWTLTQLGRERGEDVIKSQQRQ